jgi:hypothetical protein
LNRFPSARETVRRALARVRSPADQPSSSPCSLAPHPTRFLRHAPIVATCGGRPGDDESCSDARAQAALIAARAACGLERASSRMGRRVVIRHHHAPPAAHLRPMQQHRALSSARAHGWRCLQAGIVSSTVRVNRSEPRCALVRARPRAPAVRTAREPRAASARPSPPCPASLPSATRRTRTADPFEDGRALRTHVRRLHVQVVLHRIPERQQVVVLLALYPHLELCGASEAALARALAAALAE